MLSVFKSYMFYMYYMYKRYLSSLKYLSNNQFLLIPEVSSAYYFFYEDKSNAL